jgi:hypothetical protein
MKCIHCGWDHQEQDTHCVKCGHIPEGTPVSAENSSAAPYSGETIAGAAAGGKGGALTVVSASHAAAGSPAETIKDRTPGSGGGTTFYLSRWDARDQDPVVLCFNTPDDHFEFNRANLDANNNTITSKVQAEITFSDGKWEILDRSEKQSTYIQVSEPHELKQGDILLIGNKRFIFSTIHPQLLIQRT